LWIDNHANRPAEQARDADNGIVLAGVVEPVDGTGSRCNWLTPALVRISLNRISNRRAAIAAS
jgi:hypothetical protein